MLPPQLAESASPDVLLRCLFWLWRPENQVDLSDQSAFPWISPAPHGNTVAKGMTYRQWLVGMALQGLLASDSWSHPSNNPDSPKRIGDLAVEFADAAIVAQEKS